MELFGLRLKTLRVAKDLTQEQLAHKLSDIGLGSISGYERGSQRPSIEVVIELCKYFNVSSDFLLGLSDSMDFNLAPLTDEQVTYIMGLINLFVKQNERHPTTKG